MKKNRFKHCLLILLVLAFSSSVAAQDQQFTVEQLVAKADEAIDKDDYKEAAKWTRMAAEKGDPSSQEFLSTLLENGDEEFGVEKNEDEALMWLTKAAEAGSTSAQMTLARKYKEGKMVAQSYEDAIRWYEKAAKKNKNAIDFLKEIYEKMGSQSDAAGLYNLGKLLLDEKAYQEAEKYFLMSAEKGNTDAMNRLGLLHANKKEYQEAIKWYRMAAEKGHASAMCNLAFYYEKGNGVEKNAQEAIKWYRMAAEKGNRSAMYDLGKMYAEGNGVEKNAQEAIKWYRMAVEKGNRLAMCRLGDMYAKGNGVEKNSQEAIKWYRMAAEKGYELGMYDLGRMYEEGNGVAKNGQEAVKWYRMAAEKGFDIAMCRLGKMYYLRGLTKRGLPDDKKELNGEVVDFDKDDGLNSFAEAQKWFNKTIETCDRISEDATTDPIGKAAAGMAKGNAEMYLEIVKKAIDRGK